MCSLLRLTILIASISCSVGCEERLTEVSTDPSYAQMVGRRYTVSDEVKIYSILGFESPAKVDYVTLLPPPGIAGPEVAQVFPVAAGSIVTIRRVYESNRWDFDDIIYIVNIQGTDVPLNVPIHLDTGRGNSAFNDIELNPKYYKRTD